MNISRPGITHLRWLQPDFCFHALQLCFICLPRLRPGFSCLSQAATGLKKPRSGHGQASFASILVGRCLSSLA